MKKIFKIASYDFKRLITNPFTIFVMVVVLAVCMITGMVYKVEPTPAYTATTQGVTTREVYNNFASTNDEIDTKLKLDSIMEEAEEYIKIQKECDDNTDLILINASIQNIKDTVKKYITTGSCAYTENGNIDPIKNAVSTLNDFVERFKSLKELQSNVIFTSANFKELEELTAYFNEIANNTSRTVVQTIEKLHTDSEKFDQLDKIVNNVFVLRWDVNDELLTKYEQNYIEKAKAKLKAITEEIKYLSSQVALDPYDTSLMEEMTSLITNYKLTCESAKYAINYEIKLELEKHFGNLKNLYHYETLTLEDTKLALLKMNYFLDDESLYYTQYQAPLNFNSASYQVSVYDHTYFTISIVGFMTIVFGMGCAYKLFGQDRRNGKMDTILSQNVTFGQVFTGKFLAIFFITSFVLALYTAISFVWSMLLYPNLAGNILAVFNLSSIYTIHPALFLIIKIIGIELQVIFYAVITIFLMNISRKFELNFIIALVIFAGATVCNIFLNGSLVYCLFPFIHADITSFLGGATMQTGFLRTSLYIHGNFFISLIYYAVIVGLLYNFTKQLFKKN